MSAEQQIAPGTTASSASPITHVAANPANPQDAEGRQPTAATTGSSELASGKVKLKAALRHFPDFPQKGIDFVDIMPLFLDPTAHETLVSALHLQIQEGYGGVVPDVIVGLDARGFLFGPGEYQKEYGTDFFQMQEDAIKPGQKVLIVDDIIATGGSAKAAADLVKKLGGEIMGFLFILEIPGLNGREKLDGINTTILIEDA
ncbi:Adenine phosphoribosyltransferase like protein [Verticillium longisporum]|uniref:adenine phosphoribosyltransferase n=1 Tax=Verticillium longisporum TaxID=100787 RepID=A0A8I3AWI0_VERLO|nr:Adenine phosphoribosyltransferase like protein [Verticillium longisporum]